MYLSMVFSGGLSVVPVRLPPGTEGSVATEAAASGSAIAGSSEATRLVTEAAWNRAAPGAEKVSRSGPKKVQLGSDTGRLGEPSVVLGVSMGDSERVSCARDSMKPAVSNTTAPAPNTALKPVTRIQHVLRYIPKSPNRLQTTLTHP